MELEMVLNGTLIDSLPLSVKQFDQIADMQQQLVNKNIDHFRHTLSDPVFYITGIPSGLTATEKSKLKEILPK
jgi:hypothetical protein